MKRQQENSRQIVARFLGEIGEPVSEEQSDRATQDVLERLRDENVRALRVVADRRSGPQPSRSKVWGAVAATVVVMLGGGLLQMTLLRSADADVIARSARGELLIEGKADVFPPSSRIEAGKVVQAGAAGGSITLRDGSQIDMSPGAALSVVRVSDGLRVRLSTGTVLVTAAKQGDGHLYVETRDCLISVVGTVFAVNAEESGSRVSVLEGEVHVQRGDETRTLMAGQQVSTSPAIGTAADGNRKRMGGSRTPGASSARTCATGAAESGREWRRGSWCCETGKHGGRNSGGDGDPVPDCPQEQQ